MQQIHTQADWEKVLLESEKGPIVIYKHSTTCGGCMRMFSEVNEAVAHKEIKNPVYYISVQESPDLSMRIAEDLMIEHESPQAIIVVNHRACYHTQNGDIHIPGISHMLGLVGSAYTELNS